MSKEKIYLDKNGYENYLKELDNLKKELKKITAGRKEAFDAGAGDGWDSPEFEEIERQERRIMGDIERVNEEISRIVIIEKQEDDSIIDINDIVSIDLYYSEEEFENMVVKLVGTNNTADVDVDVEIKKVSINSPIGSTIYKRKVGDEGKYKVNDNTFKIIIKSKVNEKEYVKSLGTKE